MAIAKPHNILIYGDSGIGKTSQCYHLAKYFNTKHNLVGRMIGANASDTAPYEQSGMIDRGIVDFFDISNRIEALGDMRKLGDGYWPCDAKEKDGRIIPKGYLQRDANCLNNRPENLGFYLCEGVTGVSTLLLNHIRNQQEGIGFKFAHFHEEGGYNFGGLQAGHWGLIQQEMYKLIVQGFACLPLKYVVWTALIGKGEDKNSETVYGPKSAGEKTTFEIPSWYGDCFHLDTVIEEVEGKGPVEFRVAWFTKHPDKDTGINYLAKARILPELYPELLKRFPGGYVKLGFKNGLNKFYEAVDEIVGRYQKEQSNGQG